MARKRTKRIIVTANHDGSYLLTYDGVLVNNAPPQTRCVSRRSVKATITRWSRQFGVPEWVSGFVTLPL